MKEAVKQQRASISWEGDSLKQLRSWPKDIRADFGNSLGEMQDVRKPRLNVRSMSSVSSGVFELKNSDHAKWYRLMYYTKIENRIYVLHCFTKDTTKTKEMTWGPQGRG